MHLVMGPIFKALSRAMVFFTIGVTFYYLFGLLQGFRSEIFNDKFSLYVIQTNSGIPICCGILAAVAGLLSPCIYNKLQFMSTFEPDWSSVMRCLLFFVGINHATAKIDFISASQLMFTIISFSVGIWWLFDRSLGGLLIGSVTSFLGTMSCRLLGNILVINSTAPLLLSWLPCLFFSGGITISLFGRKLASSELLGFSKFKVE